MKRRYQNPMIKTLSNLLKQDKEKYKVPRKVQDVIPIRRMWSDGIFQVGSKFSKSYQFSDINYQVASLEDKKVMFLDYSELLNSLDSGATTKITINNRRLNRANFEQSILMPLRGDSRDVYRREYNQMLLDKATGANGIMQEKYITITVGKKNIEDARTYFARVGADLTAHFAALGSKCVELDATERLRILHGVYSAESSPEEYAADRFSGGTETVTYEAAHQFDKQGRKGVQATRENISKAKEHFEQRKADAEQPNVGAGQHSPNAEQHGAVMEQRKADLPKKQAREKAADRVRRRSADTAHQSVKTADREVQAIKTVERGEKTIKQSARSTGKATVKTTQKSIKTAEQTARTTIKTSQATAKAAQKSAQAAAKASHRAAQAAREAAKATAAGIKAAAKATAAAVKAIIAATKALVAAIATGGWVAVVIIVIICLIGLMVGSCFGIFFSGEDTGTGQTMQTVVREINEDYENQLDTIKANISYDVLEMSGSRAVWPEVLSVYAVKTTTDPDNAMDVATVDDSRKAILKDIFWQMNEITSRTETNTETVIEESDDGNGNIVETTTTVTRTTLYITVSHKTAEEMADQFDFDADQREQLAELLADENNSLWAAVLYGIGVSDDAIVAVALSQVGNIGGQPYWSWYGFEGRVEWCACFVSWCANECGYIENGIIPKFAGCVNGVQWFKDRGQWADNSIEPTPGMIIFFDWDSPNGSSGPQDGQSDHVGIVEKCENGIVYTVEGNSGDSCRQRQYPVGYYEILGYGIPSY